MNTFNDMYLFYGTSLAKDAQGNAALGQGVTIGYSYPTAVGQISYAAPSQLVGFVALTSEQTQAAEMARARWSDVANITWVATPNAQTSGIISIATAAMGAEGSAPLPTRTTTANPERLHVAISNTHSKIMSRPNLPVGSGGFHALLHEIGHALGTVLNVSVRRRR